MLNLSKIEFDYVYSIGVQKLHDEVSYKIVHIFQCYTHD